MQEETKNIAEIPDITGKELRYIRRQAGKTQKDVSAWFGRRSETLIVRWENDKKDEILPVGMTKIIIDNMGELIFYEALKRCKENKIKGKKNYV